MKIIWAESPLLAREIIDRVAATQKWSPKTTRTLLARLVRKRAVAYQKRGRAYLYRPVFTEADSVRIESQAFLDRVFGGAFVPMFAHFLEGRKISDSERRDLRLLLDAKK